MVDTKKRILFVTGTRADFGKLRPLIDVVENDDRFEAIIFATGMHMLSKYGSTVNEIHKKGYKNVFEFFNQDYSEPMDKVLANTVIGLGRYLSEKTVDLIIVHGDRVEALAGAITGALRNIMVGHIEGGEVSGTIDELLRHSISKLSHHHFVSHDIAKTRLMQLGEQDNMIHIIGSPNVDSMLSDQLPPLPQVKRWYDISFDNYALGILHPVTTDSCNAQNAEIFVDAILDSRQNYVILYPNNDKGSEDIFTPYERFKGIESIRVFPSLRFEYFLTLLKNAEFIIGNSSSGIHEAPIYGTPTINIGSRQHNRFLAESIVNVPFEKVAILNAIESVQKTRFQPNYTFGSGKSAELFLKIIQSTEFWNASIQKQFVDLSLGHVMAGK